MGVTGLEECIRLLATTDDPTKVWLARILVWNISGTMVPMEGDIPTAGDDETALALLRIHAHRESQPERKQRIERSVAFFEARIQAGAQREYPKMEE
jgi:hypothetical protein